MHSHFHSHSHSHSHPQVNYFVQRLILQFDRIMYMVEVDATSTEVELKKQLGVLVEADKRKIDKYLDSMQKQIEQDYAAIKNRGTTTAILSTSSKGKGETFM